MSKNYDGVWAAWLNMMPPGPGRLHVKGTLQMPTPGYELKLVEASSNSDTLVLTLIVTPPDPAVIVPQVVTEEEVRFEKQNSPEYKTVAIQPDGPDIPVEIVS